MTGDKLLSKRAYTLKPSLTLEINARAKALRAQGRDICSLSAGEPDFDTPDFIVDAAIKALKDGHTRYGPVAGDPELREAIATKITNINKVPTRASEVLVTNGGKQAIYNLLQVILNPGDEVLIPSPYWLSYPEIVSLAGAIPIILSTNASEGFEINTERLEKLINRNTRLLILNTPGNPTGRVMPINEMKALAEVLRRYPNLLIMSDEIYEFLISEKQKHYSLAAVAPDLKERILTVNGFAKAWAMTGWRVGYLSGNEKVVKAAAALQSQSTSNVCSFAQRGALAAIQGPTDKIRIMALSYNKRRSLLTEALKEIKGINLVDPTGAFYAFPELPSNQPDSDVFCKNALEEEGLALVPGSVFGNTRCIRISCAVSNEKIKEGITRLNHLISK